MIYRLACLGYDGTVAAYGSEAALGSAREQRQIRMLVSPDLWRRRQGNLIKPPAPTGARLRTAVQPRVPAPLDANASVDVPDLVGKTIVEARAIVAAAGDFPAGRGTEPRFMLLEITREVPGRPAGTVVAQTPAPSTSAKRRTSIEVVVAK